MADPSDIDVQRVFERFTTAHNRPVGGGRIRRRLSLFPWVGGAQAAGGGEVQVDEPSGSDGEADGLDQGTIIYDGGFSDVPTFNNQGNGKRAGGTTTDFAKFLFSIGVPQAGYTYTMTYDPDFSGLSQGGKLAMVGFGFKSGNPYHFTGLKGDGDTGLNANKAFGPNFKQLKAGTETNGGAASHGTQAGPNWLQIEIGADGDTYTLRTSSDGTTWADEFTDSVPSPISNATDATDFGIALYLDGSDVGAFTIDITLWEQAAVSSGFTATPTAFISADNAVLPFLSAASYPHAAYVSGLDKTFIAWERVTQHESSVAAIVSYDHGANAWSTVYDVGTWLDIDDAHGQPVYHYGPDSHHYVFFGAHAADQEWAISANADDISEWTRQTAVSGSYTYPKPVTVGSDIHCLWRKRTADVWHLVHRKGTPSSGSLTFGSEQNLIDFNDGGAGDGGRVYASEVHRVGTALHFTATRADANDTTREHVYYFIYETTTGALGNVDGSTSVASGSLPINLTTANASFRIVEHTGTDRNLGLPSLAFDTSGQAHVTYGDGTPDGLGRVQAYHTFWDGDEWSTPAEIAMVEVSTYVPLVPALSGAMEAWYPQDDGDAYANGGVMCRRTWNGSTWAAQETMATPTGSYPHDRPFSIRDAHADMRVAWCEFITSQDYGAADTLQRFIHGDSGFAVGPDPAVLQYAADTGDDVLHVKVDGGGSIYDLTGNHVTVTSATVSGTEMVFNGSTARVHLPDSSGYTPAGDWTMVFEGLKFADVSTLQTVMGHQNGAGAIGWRVLFSSTGIHLEGDTGSGNALILSYLASFTQNQAYDVAFERKGNTLRIYRDDLTAGNHVASGALTGAFVNVAQPLVIGMEYNLTAHRRFLNGRLTRARLTHEALYAA